MNTEYTKKNILKKLSSLTERLEYISNIDKDTDMFVHIERSLLDISDIQETLIILKYNIKNTTKNNTSEIVKQHAQEDLFENTLKKDTSKTVQHVQESTSEKHTTTVAKQNIPENQSKNISEKHETTKTAKQNTQEKRPKENISHNQKTYTLHEKIQPKNSKKILAEKLQQNVSLNDVEEGINLQLKYLFMQQLFKGSQSEYRNSISHIKNCSNVDDAMRTIDDFSKKYQWKEKHNTTIETLKNIVKRTYI